VADNETCGTCRHVDRPQTFPRPQNGECTAHPPSAQIVMAQGALGHMQPQVVAAFPPRPATARACGEWEAEQILPLPLLAGANTEPHEPEDAA
jgi:hypothetical protein